jgi:hypothetical protein
MELTLKSGHVLIIDDADYPLIRQHKWRMYKGYGSDHKLTRLKMLQQQLKARLFQYIEC